MFLENIIHEVICLLNLFQRTGACNNDTPCLERTDCNALTVANRLTCACSLTRLWAETNAWWTLLTCLVKVELCIYTLIDCGLKCTEETIRLNKNLMELAVAANGYDIKKLPLGDLSSETIQKGYTVLSEIEKAINNKETSKL